MYDKKQIKKSARICSSVDFAGYYPAGAHAGMIAIKNNERKDSFKRKGHSYHFFWFLLWQ